MKLYRVGVIPDVHIPYEDKRAYQLAIKVLAEQELDELVVLGDYADFYSVSSFTKDPKRNHQLFKEVGMVNEAIDQLDKLFPKAKRTFLIGNHEARLDKYIATKAPELFDVTSTAKILELPERGWRVIPHGQHYRIGKLFFHHGDVTKYSPANAAAKMVSKFQHSIIFGHTHKYQLHTTVNALGEEHTGLNLGWLGNAKDADYVNSHQDWVHAFGIVDIEDNGHFHIQPVKIVNYKCVVNKKLYRG